MVRTGKDRLQLPSVEASLSEELLKSEADKPEWLMKVLTLWIPKALEWWCFLEVAVGLLP